MSSRGESPNSHTRNSSRGREFRQTLSPPRPSRPDSMRGLISEAQKIIPVPSIACVDTELKITELEVIGSYDLVVCPAPTIRVPGSPPEWTDIPTPFQVPIDANTFPMQQPFPTMPFLPLFYAVDAQCASSTQPPPDWPHVDIVTDRNNLTKLLRWINGTATTFNGDFRIDLCLVGKRTVLLNRWAEGHIQRLYPNTFGYSFKRRTTGLSVGGDNGTKHHRIVKYNLDGLNMVVRFQADAYVPQSQSESIATGSGEVGDLSAILSALHVTPPSTSPRRFKDERLPVEILHGGNPVPQSDLVELATISYKRLRMFDWSEKYAQALLGQVPHLFYGVHDKGQFTSVKKLLLPSDFTQAAIKARNDIRKLREALAVIQSVAIENGPQCSLALVCQSGELKVFSRESHVDFLPRDLLMRFEPSTNTS